MTQEAHLWPIEYYEDSRRRCDVEDFIVGLPAAERTKVARYLLELEAQGVDLRLPYAKKLTGWGGLRELLPKPIRLLYFIDDRRRCVVVLAFRKKGNRTPRKFLEKAERRMHEILGSDQ
jgi:phage-related protein